MSTTETRVILNCDHPECKKVLSLKADGPGSFETQEAEAGWVTKDEKDYCPKHGECHWCDSVTTRVRLVTGAGECVGQLICATCVIAREG